MTTVAAVVSVFDNGASLSACLNSVFNQTRPFDEVIVVDDDSRDPPTIDILASREWPRGARLFHNQCRMGRSVTKNKGAALGESDYVAFIDGDDRISNDANASICEAIGGAINYVFSDEIGVDESGRRLRRRSFGDRISGHPQGLEDLLLDRMVVSRLAVVRRRTFIKLDGFDSDFDGSEDWDLALRVSEFGGMVHVPLPLCLRRIRERRDDAVSRAASFMRTNEVRRAALERRRHAVRKVADASVRSRAEHAARLMASAFGVGPDRRTMAPPGGLVVALDGGPVKMFSLYEPTTAAGVKDGAVCLVLSDHSGRLGALRHLGVCDRTFVGLVVFPDPRSIAEAQEYNSHFDFLVHLDGETKCAVASYGWSGLVEYALE